MSDVAQQVTELVRDIANDPGVALAGDAPLIEGGVIDSLGIIQLVKVIEEHFGIEIDVEDVVEDNFATVDAITELVEGKQSTRQ